MTKHVSSGGEATSSSRDAATESLPIRESADATDAAAQHLPQGAVGAPGSDGNTAGNTDGSTDVKDLKAAAGSAGSEAVRTEALAKDVTPDSAKGSGAAHSAAGSSTVDTRLGGAWASPDAQNAATIGVVPSTSAAAKKARTKARGPWYRRRAVVGAAGVALLAGSFGAGWGTNELLSSHSQHGQAQQQGAGNGQGGPGGGGPGGHGGPGGQMPGGGPGGQGGQGGPGGQNGQNGQGGPGGGSGGAGRTTPNGDASSGSGSSGGQQSGSGSGDGKQKGGSGSSGVLQQQDASPSTQG